ncbi:expressed unknown protein [Seminavis robusta]|uniref:Transmembrane protein n=1 Tax=Seminavis robusta TaxID=568900 RepID=A0A9N8EV84_9STRA|nr:expressed unknown protein [Seminavis robusta]|eukprot:Sro1924_g305700.1 n/a (145) ;mRNA; f:7340-7774
MTEEPHDDKQAALLQKGGGNDAVEKSRVLDIESSRGGTDENNDDMIHGPPNQSLLHCMYLSTLLTVLFVTAALNSLILTRKSKMIPSYYFTLTVIPAMLSFATIKMWTSFREERNYRMAFHLSLPSMVLAGIILLLLLIHAIKN